MKYNLDSALVIVLRDAIKWESSIVTYNGTLAPVDYTAPINPLTYQRRDRELAFRDLITASAIIETSVQISDVWNYAAAKPLLQGPVVKDMPEIDTTQMRVWAGNSSTVRHVKNVSIPIDAARYADTDLYGRDALIYETLARLGQDAFTEAPLTRVDSQGTVFDYTGTFAWSLAEGTAAFADINSSLPMGLNAFKQPDMNLADRDNQLAAYTATLAQTLKNPFEHAMRIYVQVDATLPADQRESEVYTLESEDTSTRVWVCEPALSLRNRIVYDIADKTLQWFRESDTEVHQPQIVAMAIPGVVAGQTITTLPAVPEGKDCQYWRSKAGQIKPPGTEIVDVNSIVVTTDPGVVTGGIIQPDSVSLTAPGKVSFGLPSALPADHYRVSILVQPDPTVSIFANQNTTSTTGTLGGATYGIYSASPATLPVNLYYIVVGGDGVDYNGNTYLAGDVFVGVSPLSGYTQHGASVSVVRQYLVNFRMALPPGPWTAEMGYTNLAGVTTGFGIRSQMVAQGANPVDVFQDLTPMPFSSSNGDVLITPRASFDVPYISETTVPAFDFPVMWTYGDGSLSIRSLVFRSALPVTQSGSYAMTAALSSQAATAYITAERLLPEVLRFEFTTSAPTADFSLAWLCSSSLYDQSNYVPLKLKQLQVQRIQSYAATPLADEFQGWRQECLDRTEDVVQQGYTEAVAARIAVNGTVPTFRGSGSIWDATASENWMSFVEISNPRLREVADIPATGCFVSGRQYEVTSGTVTYGASYTLGKRFYATDALGVNFTGGTVKQVGAFMKSMPGHIGKPALIPYGLYFTSYGTAAAYYDTDKSYPTLVACQPWMVDAGIYVAQSEFWMPEHI
jgi:hypothetical protein